MGVPVDNNCGRLMFFSELVSLVGTQVVEGGGCMVVGGPLEMLGNVCVSGGSFCAFCGTSVLKWIVLGGGPL